MFSSRSICYISGTARCSPLGTPAASRESTNSPDMFGQLQQGLVSCILILYNPRSHAVLFCIHIHQYSQVSSLFRAHLDFDNMMRRHNAMRRSLRRIVGGLM